mgnify:CR=1 FL=1
MVHSDTTTPTETAATVDLLGSWPDLEGTSLAAFLHLRPGALSQGCRAAVLFGGGCDAIVCVPVPRDK